MRFAQHIAMDGGEDEVSTGTVGEEGVELVGEEARQWDRSGLVRFRCAPGQGPAVDLGDALTDVEPPPDQVDVLGAQRRQLRPPQPAVGEDQDRRRVGAVGLR
ncbi:MAG: hypothetical protein JWN20_1550 [Jatrophihabitantaceae bacterium]|nr:hypothetical protein [Jatrophihabitantaceae bacterium]